MNELGYFLRNQALHVKSSRNMSEQKIKPQMPKRTGYLMQKPTFNLRKN